MEAGAELAARARLICGERHVITEPAELSVYRSDGLRRNGPLPLAAILPGSAAEVAGVVSACAATSIPYVVRGAGTSHSGGALPIAGAVLIVLTRLRRILAHEPQREQVTVEAGVPAASLPQPRATAWFSGADPPAVATVGGHVAETAGIANVCALELVQPDGKRVSVDDRTPGYDLTGAFPGSRGHAGIAVTLTLRAVSRQ
jgi:glycolate oxidase